MALENPHRRAQSAPLVESQRVASEGQDYGPREAAIAETPETEEYQLDGLGYRRPTASVAGNQKVAWDNRVG